MEFEVLDFINDHHDNWKDLLRAKPYCITINEDESYYLLKYNQTESDFSLNIVRECRGFIINKTYLSYRALSFTKFFNYGEEYAANIDWKSAKVQEKIDGSKILVWYGDRKWHISTSGVIDAFNANVSNFDFSFGDLFINALRDHGLEFYPDRGICKGTNKLLDERDCYTFELVSPKSRLVVPYEKTDIYLIGKRYQDPYCNDNYEEDPQYSILCDYIPRPKEYKLESLKACIDAANRMGFDEEGFVVVDKYYNRIKIKSPAYVAASYLRNNGVYSKSRLLDMIETNECAEFLSYYPEWKEEITEMSDAKDRYFNEAYAAIKFVQYLKDNDTSRKDIAYMINSKFKNYSNILFTFLDTDLVKLYINSEWNKMSSDKKVEVLQTIGEKEQE